jgi:hypothetical protein
MMMKEINGDVLEDIKDILMILFGIKIYWLQVLYFYNFIFS